MPHRRILSIWFPRFGAERLLRHAPHLVDTPFAVVSETGNMQTLCSLSKAASKAGLYQGQPLRDAHAMCSDLVTRLQNPHTEANFLGVLHRWAGKFSPWVARENPDALIIDLTGCAHLFGGEEPLMAQITQDCSDLGLSVRLGIADTLGAAWALARFSGVEVASHRNGDAIDQEARATRARAGKRRHWERGGSAPVHLAEPSAHGRIAAPGQAHSALSALPVAALRIEPDLVTQLSRLGLRRIGDLLGQPRAALARRFGRGLVARMDQAIGSAPEPISPTAPPDHFATRLNLPDPIGLIDDVMAGIDRMLPRLCAHLKRKGRGVRTLRLEAYLTDNTMQWTTVSLARPSYDEDRIRPLLRMKIEDIDAGYGIDMLRLEVVHHEPVQERTPVGHLEAGRAVRERLAANTDLDDLIAKIGARIGLESITRHHPGESHIPEKGAQVVAAAWSEPVESWPKRIRRRPVMIWRPEPVNAPDTPKMPEQFRWRGRRFETRHFDGPERIAPEWWLDDPEWRSGPRDYWRVDTDRGERLWLYYAHGGTMSSGWFCQGSFG